MNPYHTNFKQYIPLATKDLSISLGSKNPNIPLNSCNYSTETAYSTRDISFETLRKYYAKSRTLTKLKNHFRHRRELNPQRMNYAGIFQSSPLREK